MTVPSFAFYQGSLIAFKVYLFEGYIKNIIYDNLWDYLRQFMFKNKRYILTWMILDLRSWFATSAYLLPLHVATMLTQWPSSTRVASSPTPTLPTTCWTLWPGNEPQGNQISDFRNLKIIINSKYPLYLWRTRPDVCRQGLCDCRFSYPLLLVAYRSNRFCPKIGYCSKRFS